MRIEHRSGRPDITVAGRELRKTLKRIEERIGMRHVVSLLIREAVLGLVALEGKEAAKEAAGLLVDAYLSKLGPQELEELAELNAVHRARASDDNH
jgi:hypothetical protein